MFPRELVPFLKENSLFFGEVVFFPWGTIMSFGKRNFCSSENMVVPWGATQALLLQEHGLSPFPPLEHDCSLDQHKPLLP